MKPWVIALLVALMIGCRVGFALASFNVYDFETPEQAAQFQQLIHELRCPKCQNNNLADSNSPLATDIKNYIAQSVRQGQSSDDITAFLVSRYGQYITYNPRQLWLSILPFIVGLIGLCIAIYRINRQRKTLAFASAQAQQSRPENPDKSDYSL